MKDKYDNKDRNSIYTYAKKMEGKTFREISQSYNAYLNLEENVEGIASTYNRKGELGDLIETNYFGFSLDNQARADFPEANLELKVTPFKVNRNSTLSVKERLIITMINYHDVVNQTFYHSNVWKKIEHILLVYYKWEKEIKDKLDYIIKYVYLFSPNKTDLKIIENDYRKIVDKIKKGKAHELSEADTLYLGAVTKAANSSVLTTQPFSEIMAKPRAFSFKTTYMNTILRNEILPNKLKSEKITEDLSINFEDYIIRKIKKYSGYKDQDLFEIFLGNKDDKSKHRYSRVALKMLGVRTKNAEEFEKANIVVKAIRVEENNKIVESMSFSAFSVMKLIEESWEESDIYNYFTGTKFLFIIYRKKKENYYLDRAQFWNMPYEDIEGSLKNEWERARNIFIEGVKLTPIYLKNKTNVSNNLPKLSDTNILHVRNHSSKSVYMIGGKIYGNGNINRDADLLPNGDYISKQCFWLNNKYIEKIIKE